MNNAESIFKAVAPKEQVKNNPNLENWFGKEFKHINLPKAVKLEDTLGFAGNMDDPYFLIFIQLESADVRAVSYEDPFTKKSEIKHYTIDCTWEVAVGNAYAKRLAIETDWNALTLGFSDDWGQQKIFSWNMATAKQTVFEPANGEDIVFSSRIAGPFSRAESIFVGGGEFKTESAAIAGAKEACVFSGVKRPTFSTLNDIGFRVEGGNKKLYGPQTVLVIFLKS